LVQKIDVYKKQIIVFCQKWKVKEFASFGSFLEAAKDIHDFVKKTNLKDFSSDKKTRYAVERQLLVIG
jgi:hypothetical protein